MTIRMSETEPSALPGTAARPSEPLTLVPDTPADNDLIASMQRGELAAFGALYDRYSDRAYRVARMITRDRMRAEEVVQDAFSSIWRASATYRPERATAAAWVLTVVRNQAIDAARRDARLQARSAADTDLTAYPAVHDVAGEALDRVTASEIRGLLDRLSDAQREVIILAFYGQLSHSEIAQALGLPLGTVKARLRRGLHALRGELGDQAA
jgi:RNA polymerase sigma-70 factor (ECF subfamily)